MATYEIELYNEYGTILNEKVRHMFEDHYFNKLTFKAISEKYDYPYRCVGEQIRQGIGKMERKKHRDEYFKQLKKRRSLTSSSFFLVHQPLL